MEGEEDDGCARVRIERCLVNWIGVEVGAALEGGQNAGFGFGCGPVDWRVGLGTDVTQGKVRRVWCNA